MRRGAQRQHEQHLIIFRAQPGSETPERFEFLRVLGHQLIDH
jgi:hypothetical protein